MAELLLSKLFSSSACLFAISLPIPLNKIDHSLLFLFPLMHDYLSFLNLPFLGSELSKDPKDWTVTLGEHHLKNEDWFEQSRQVKAIYLHPQYKEAENVVSNSELKGIPPDYDVGKIIITVKFNRSNIKQKRYFGDCNIACKNRKMQLNTIVHGMFFLPSSSSISFLESSHVILL